jgi:hypothetical protein
MASVGAPSVAYGVLKGMPVLHPSLRGPLGSVRHGLWAEAQMLPRCRVFSEGKVLYSGCDGRHFEVMRGMASTRHLPPPVTHNPH